MLDLNQVAVFVEVVRSGSFAAAARRLATPPNTVSRYVQQLESALGSRLLHRSTRKLTLTAAGQSLFDRCAHAVADIAQAGQDLADGGELPSGLVRVAAPADFIDGFSIEWIAEFLGMYPKVRVEFALSDARADLIGEGIDVAFRATHLEQAPHAVARQLFTHHFVLVASPDYLAARGMPRDLQALADHDCLLLRSNAPAGPVVWRLQGPGGMTEVAVSGRFGANTAGAVLQGALAGLGVALLPALVAGPHVRSGQLAHVLPDHRRDGGGMQVVLPSRRQIPRAVSAFVDFAAQRVQWDWQASAV